MTGEATARPGTSPAPVSGALQSIWALLTNVKFALLLVGLATAGSLIGVVVPQMPAEMRDNPAAQSAWLELRRDDYGFLTDPMNRLDLFDLFHSTWFIGLWVVIIVAVTVCTVSRLRPTWRNVERPPERVADRYFETARHRASFNHPGGSEAVRTLLKRKRFRVRDAGAEGEATYLFADRFGWTQYGTFLSHLALLLLLVGGVLTAVSGFSRTLALAEGVAGAPVFTEPGGGQIFVTMLDAHEGVDAEGNIVDYHSDLLIQRGGETVNCTTTVNEPCSAFGYRFHQAAFFNDLAQLTIRDADGRLLFDNVLDFNNETTVLPVVRLTDGDGRVWWDQPLPQMASFEGDGSGPPVALAQLTIPVSSDESLNWVISWQRLSGDFVVSISGEGIEASALRRGDSAAGENGVVIEYLAPVSIPATPILDLPGANETETATVQLVPDANGDEYLYITGVGEQGLAVTEDIDGVSPGGVTYAFGGRVDAAGIDIRRDPGDTFIWIAVIGALIGLTITFWVPSRRLWVKVTPARTYVAGAAERTARLSRELEALGRELNAGGRS